MCCLGYFKLVYEAIWELWKSIDLMENLGAVLFGFDRYYNWFTEVSEPEQFLELPPIKEVFNVLVWQLEVYEILFPEDSDYLSSILVSSNECVLYCSSLHFNSFAVMLIDLQVFSLNLVSHNVDAWFNAQEFPVNVSLRVILLWCKIFIASIFTIWARGVGPRVRPDQLSDITWKDFLLNLLGFLILVIYYLMLG